MENRNGLVADVEAITLAKANWPPDLLFFAACQR
jgi:hypothetical protein